MNHGGSADDMKKIGQDIEKITLAKGLQCHLEDRVLACHNKTKGCVISGMSDGGSPMTTKSVSLLLSFQIKICD